MTMLLKVSVFLTFLLSKPGFSSSSLQMKTGLSLSTTNDSKDLFLVVGDRVSLSYSLLLRKGGTGLIGIKNQRIIFNIDNSDNLEKVPDEEIIDLPEEESCPASEMKDTEIFEVLTNFTVEVKVVKAGQSIILTSSIPNTIDTADSSITLNIKKSRTVEDFVNIIGWISFILWSISFYPQIFNNFKRKSVAGLNIDFVVFNVVGFALYSCFNLNLLFNKEIQGEYILLHPGGVIPVELNDVVFSVHATLAASITLTQCVLLDRAGQKMSPPCQLSLILTAVLVVVVVSLASFGYMTWLGCLYVLSYVKLAITLVKYIPQAFMNFRNKSTKGWSIGNILLDLMGGLFSLLQMVLVAYNSADWTSLTGDPTKLWLAAVSMAFDGFFMIQHFLLYRNNQPYVQIH